jgi:hypothetical protein
MASFTKPTNLNGKTLVAELEASGITVKADETGLKAPWDKADGTIEVAIAKADESKAEAVIAAHSG